MENNNHKKIADQIEKNMKQAFYDLIDQNTNSENPDFDWIVNLYVEIKEKLMHYLKKDSDTYKSVDESFDVEIFSQMIRNDVFSQESMIKLVDNTFYWIKYLGAPYRDNDIDSSKKKVLESPLNKIISVFLKEVHQCLTFYDEDMEQFFRQQK
jgi:alpha-amylase/alpha-mannosidase (GH57 family)